MFPETYTIPREMVACEKTGIGGIASGAYTICGMAAPSDFQCRQWWSLCKDTRKRAVSNTSHAFDVSPGGQRRQAKLDT